jgi:prevent-host-death family protein
MTTSDRKTVVVPATEANRRFSELLRGVREEGTTFTITSHGRAVAEVGPPEEIDEERERKRAQAWAAIKKRYASTKGIKIEPWTREELYEREPRK